MPEPPQSITGVKVSGTVLQEKSSCKDKFSELKLYLEISQTRSIDHTKSLDCRGLWAGAAAIPDRIPFPQVSGLPRMQ